MKYADFVIKSYRTTPRSLSEAFKTPEYACAITKPKEGFWHWIKSF